MKVEKITRQIGATPPEDADEYVRKELHPVSRDSRDRVNELAGYSWCAKRAVTSDATDTLVAFYEFRDGETARVHMRACGIVAGDNCVIEEWDVTYSWDGSSLVKQHINLLTGQIYPPGSALTTACACLVENGNVIEGRVTGEADTTITWEPYFQVQEVSWAARL